MNRDDSTKPCRQCQFFLKGECSHFIHRDGRPHAGACPAFNRRPPDWGFFVKF